MIRIFIFIAVVLLSADCREGNPARDDQTTESETEQTAGIKEPNSSIRPVTGRLVGRKVPTFASTTLEEKTIDSTYFKGKTTIIYFWSAACKACALQVSGLNDLVARYGTNRFNYLAVSQDDVTNTYMFLDGTEWEFEQIANGTALTRETFGITWDLPTALIVDANGTIINGFAGGDVDLMTATAMQERIESAIGELE